MEICRQPVTDAAAWTRADISDTTWVIQLGPEDLEDLESARRSVAEKGFTWGNFGWGDFPVPRMKQKLAAALRELAEGRGFVLFRGLPVENYDLDQLKTIYWGLGVHLGLPLGQNRRGDLIGHVEAVRDPPKARQGDRGYWRPAGLPFHTDFTDAVGLLCVRKAKEGGNSVIVSSTTIHNHVLRSRPDLLPILYAGMHTNLRNEGPTRVDNEPSPSPIPVFEYRRGNISCFFSKNRYLSGQEATGVPFTKDQLEALAYFDEVAQLPQYSFEMTLEPGDVQFLNCHTTLHSRRDYTDYEEPDRKRLLLRLWVRFAQEDYRVSPARSRIFRWGMSPSHPALA